MRAPPVWRRRVVAVCALGLGTIGVFVARIVSSSSNRDSSSSFVVMHIFWGGGNPHPSNSSSTHHQTQRGLRVSNEYERKAARPIGDGLYAHEHLVDVALATRHETTTTPREACRWRVVRKSDGAVVSESGGERAESFEALYPSPGDYVVVAESAVTTTRHDVAARRVRREIRTLSRIERERYLSAIHTIYSTPDAAGRRMYGEEFLSITWLVREHLYGAASKECDHWHDDAGFATHHVAITWQFENSIASVDPTMAAHYWDYTIDAAEYGDAWATSPIFGDAWFGSANPNNADHVVDAGRWAYVGVMEHARSYSNVTNPYGLLRSPWNTNKIPFVMRSSYVLGKFAGGFSTFPSCDEFSMALLTNAWVGTTFNQLNGGFHGPVHIMTGGYWGWDPAIWGAKTETGRLNPISFLLFAKFLWRQGYARCPDKCSMDTPQDQCRCSCPTEIVGGRSARDVLNASGAFDLNAFVDVKGISYDDILEGLCGIGFPGEMFTSAAPQDPLFWPLHGNAERFLQYARILEAKGVLRYDETWGYDHSADLASDTGVVCDWTDVTGMQMPKCVPATCPGHREDDLLPFDNLFPGAEPRVFTNAEFFFDIINPASNAMPYVYDTLTSWPGCDGGILGKADDLQFLKDDLEDEYNDANTSVPAVTVSATGLFNENEDAGSRWTAPLRNMSLFKESKHPGVAFFHLLFKTLAIVVYEFSTMFTTNFVLVCVVCILLLAFDFWTVKNVSGRLLVGLRWWNYVREDGTTEWVFESTEDMSEIGATDRRLFWVGLYAPAFVWGFFLFMAVIKLNIQWLIVIIAALSLSSANIIGYTKCSKEARQRLEKFAAGGVAQNLVGAIGVSNILSGIGTIMGAQQQQQQQAPGGAPMRQPTMSV
ncbi:hypothetical protein CTAYLR_006440 [Chrysophaeum taylorii]|uniref:Tyrosinase copper-binding domain-containing protein n=1 Tax=Chrysophaeum taylorii TaxID=2483200 RepID=A0AAD7ULC6_9STRA|nr:hypothetical protein CTAYLR_006440 [Chrysophaeum taylorii]